MKKRKRKKKRKKNFKQKWKKIVKKCFGKIVKKSKLKNKKKIKVTIIIYMKSSPRFISHTIMVITLSHKELLWKKSWFVIWNIILRSLNKSLLRKHLIAEEAAKNRFWKITRILLQSIALIRECTHREEIERQLWWTSSFCNNQFTWQKTRPLQ